MWSIGVLIVFINGALSDVPFHSTCNYFEIKPTSRFSGFPLYWKGQQTITRCARECFLRSQCLSITFNTTTNGCTTHTSDDIMNPEKLWPSNKTSYVGMYSWTLTRDLGGCATRPCPIQTRCTPLRNNNYTCIISECDDGPGVTILNTVGWRWRPVGKTKTLKCKKDYYLNGTEISSTCLANGTWTHTAEIMAECLPGTAPIDLPTNTTTSSP